MPDVRVSYETYGKLNSNSSNAIFIEHALTGDSHADLDLSYAAFAHIASTKQGNATVCWRVVG